MTRLFLVAAPGLEETAAEEARRCLRDAAVTRVDGGVEVVGAVDLIARANLLLRLPTRVLLRLGEVEARDFARLRRGVAQLAWGAYLPEGVPVEVRASASKSRLYHTGAIAEHVAAALAEAVGATAATASPGANEDDPPLSLLVRGHADRFTLSLDTSGARLHLRGWRTEGGAAPLRETLAAALLALADHGAEEALIDPMCGSGTIVIEAALRQIGRAPGLDRRFAFQRFVGYDATAWESLRAAARQQERLRCLPILGADEDAGQLEIARRNASRAGVAELLRFEHTPLASLRPSHGAGLVVTNPPYGRRIGQRAAIPALYGQLGQALRGPFGAWRAAILVEDRALLAGLGMERARTHALSNGGLRVWVGRREAGLRR